MAGQSCLNDHIELHDMPELDITSSPGPTRPIPPESDDAAPKNTDSTPGEDAHVRVLMYSIMKRNHGLNTMPVPRTLWASLLPALYRYAVPATLCLAAP